MPAAKKKASGKASDKKTPAKKGGGRRRYGDLTQTEMKVLECLEDGDSKTRTTMKEETGIQKGWSKMLGAPTKPDGVGPDTLEGKGYVKHEKLDAQGEGDNKTPAGFYYKIMAKGQKALEKARKEKEKADAEE